MTRGILALIVAFGIGSALFATAHAHLHTYNARAVARLAVIDSNR